MGEIGREERLALSDLGLLLQLKLELLLLLLENIVTSEPSHHVSGHHVGKHVREREGSHLLVVTASSCAELLETVELGSGLSEVESRAGAAAVV